MAWTFLHRKIFFITILLLLKMSLIDIGLSVYPFLLEWVLIIFVFKGVCPFHLNCQVCWPKALDSVPLLSFQHL